MHWRAVVVFASALFVFVCGAPKSAKKSKVANTGLPSCKDFKCPNDQKKVPKEFFTPQSYGCLEMPQLDKCCVERDVCMQTCGMRSKTCFSNFVACSAKICGGDSTCVSNAKVLGEATGGRGDKELCKTYLQSQHLSCECASKYVWKGEVNKRLAGFYKKHQPDKLDTSGRLRDANRIWNKWEGNESSLFLALTMKYWHKSVDLKEKPGQKPRSGSKKGPSSSGRKSKTQSRSPSPASKKGKVREHGRAKASGSESEFAKELRVLKHKMRAAATEEDYITARALQVQVQERQEKEIMRLEYAKERAVKAEDFPLAKSIKAEQQQLQNEVQKALDREESARKQAATPQRANIDRVGSRARLEREDVPVVGDGEAHDGADGGAEEDTEGTDADEPEAASDEDEL